MVLGGLNVQILHQKMLLRRTCSSETKQKEKILFTCFELCANFDLLLSVSNQGPHDPQLSMLTNRLQRHLRYVWEIWNTYTKKIFFPKLQKSEEILDFRKKLKFSFSEFRKNSFDNFTKSI